MKTLRELRRQVRELVAPGEDKPIRWRMVSIEYQGGIAPVCTANQYQMGDTFWPTHNLDAAIFGEGARDETGLYDCCPEPHIECRSEAMAEYLVALLNADAADAENSERLFKALSAAEQKQLDATVQPESKAMCFRCGVGPAKYRDMVGDGFCPGCATVVARMSPDVLPMTPIEGESDAASPPSSGGGE